MSEIDWSKAPEGATYCAPEGLSREPQVCWYRRHEGRWEYFSPNRREWRLSANGPEFHDRLIPRPTQWRGPEDGLPGMGDVCEYCPATSEDVWYRCIFIGTVGGEDFVLRSDNVVDRMKSGVRGRFRGLKSDKERAVEAAMRHYGEVGEWKLSPSDFCGDLYDAGLLRLPEGQS